MKGNRIGTTIGLVTLLAAGTPAYAAPAGASDSTIESPEPPRVEASVPPTTPYEAVRQERRALEAQRAELEQMKSDLSVAEASIDARIEALKQVVNENKAILEKTEALRKTILNDKMVRLIKLTEKMPAPEAAAYLSKLDEPTASTILQGVRVRQASKIMAALSPAKAASLSRTYLKYDESSRRRTGTDQPPKRRRPR